ncbi:hypothetical protein N657DRAFT_654332 [Parathielavia appendiculata]|uniref:Uncharacterized protein n=1 Tax=Parathielavia appendiculata TaxID=2587402 RepID=A0AAN6Z5W7_9PEZI|nr:hypothetical protein N657DRAFT_654332 [Parathielavia appendiculata]
MSAPTATRSGAGPLAALTSVFTPPCPTSWLLTTTRLPSQYPAFPTRGLASCDPLSWRTNIARAGFHYYHQPSVLAALTNEGFPAILPGETAVYCVPIGLTCTTDITDSRGGVWAFARDATTAGPVITVGPAIQTRWVEADFSMLETHPLTPGLRLARTEAGTTLVTSARSTTTTSSTTETTGKPKKGPATEDDNEPASSDTLITDTNTRSEGVTLIFETGSPTGSLGLANTASGNPSGKIGSLDRGTGIVVIFVVTVVAGILVWVATFRLIRRYRKAVKRKKSRSRKKGHETSLEKVHRHTRANSATPKSMASPTSELDSGSPAIGSTPNPAELEGDLQLPPRAWMHQRLWDKGSSLQPPHSSPRSMQSTVSTRRTIRESFGEKVNDPAAVLNRLRIPNPLSMGRPSPGSASPTTRSFWRLPRSPASPSAAARLSAQLPKSSPRYDLSGNAPRASTPGRGKPANEARIKIDQQNDRPEEALAPPIRADKA